MGRSLPPHHLMLGSTFNYYYLSGLKHYALVHIYHISSCLVQVQHASIMTFVHLNIYWWVLILHHFILASFAT